MIIQRQRLNCPSLGTSNLYSMIFHYEHRSGSFKVLVVRPNFWEQWWWDKKWRNNEKICTHERFEMHGKWEKMHKCRHWPTQTSV